MKTEININPLITVIVLIYNTERYLNRCLDSIISQTYTNLEIICIDDGSTDNSGKICDEYAMQHKIIKVIHKKNEGVAIARNIGLQVASGEYINFVDSDDWIEAQTYKCAIDIMLKFQPDFIKWSFYEVNKKNKKIPISIPFYSSGHLEGLKKKELICDIISGKMKTNSLCDALFKKTIINNYHIRIPRQTTQGEDLYLLISYLLHCKTIYLLSENYFYNYSQNFSSLSKKYSNKYLSEILILIENMSNLVKDDVMFDKALSIRTPILIFYTILLIVKSKTSLSCKLQEIKNIMSYKEFTKRIDSLKFTDYISLKTLPVFLAYKGFPRISLYFMICLNKAYLIYKSIKYEKRFKP
jgi:glycosyltransferase involved in cell wall biosynthesis